MSDIPADSRPSSFELVTVASGARTLRSLEHSETFHPVVGPMTEARELHVKQQRLVERARTGSAHPFVIWDVGLGAAANAIAVLEAFRDSSEHERPVELHSFDRTIAPLRFALKHAAELGYFADWDSTVETLIRECTVQIRNLTWHLHVSDFREVGGNTGFPSPNGVMFDPYSPASNPELWNLDVFTAIRQRADETEGCTFTSYSRSTAVRVTLLLAGWMVGRGGATGEKDETTVAATRLDLLANPLDRRWLDRVRRSTAPGPLTSFPSQYDGSAIAETLSHHPQFAL